MYILLYFLSIPRYNDFARKYGDNDSQNTTIMTKRALILAKPL